MQYLLDTNVIIYYFNGLTNDAQIEGFLINSFNLSIISKIEFLGWNGFVADKALYHSAQTFIENANIFPLDESVAQRAIELWQQYKIKTPDAIIASTALIYGFGIVTNDNTDFKRLGLKIINIQLAQEP